MSNLLASLRNSSQALDVYQRVLGVTQNNVSNASTPGYASQSMNILAMPFDSELGTLGGIEVGEVTSARDQYAEATVRRRVTDLGRDSQSVTSLTKLQSIVDVSGNSGVSAALSAFYQSASDWSMAANSTYSRQEVLDRASDVAESFRQAATSVGRAGREAENQVRDTVEQINTLAGRIADLNHEIRAGARNDAGVDANMQTTLEELSQYVGFTTIQQQDGSVTVMMDGRTPLVIGDNQYNLSFGLTGAGNGTATASVFGADGVEITSQITEGKLGALLDFRNRVVAGILGGPTQDGDLNRLAQAVADRVNTILTSGQQSDGPPVVAGVALFTYDNTSPAGVAASLGVDTAVTPGDLGAIDPGPPYVSNGIALRLAALATPDDNADKLDGLSYAEFFGQIGTRIGRDLNDAETAQQTGQSLVAQAKDLRQQASGVSLDEQAILLLEFQRAYQAMSQFIKTLDELTQEAISLLR